MAPARDMAAALGDRVPVIGVPAGVKMHSAVYATSPRAAADLALRALAHDIDARPREVMDIDERGVPRRQPFWRSFTVTYQFPYAPNLTQSVKAGGVSSDREALSVGSPRRSQAGMEAGRLYILGPGTTTRAVADTHSACPRPCSVSTWLGTGR